MDVTAVLGQSLGPEKFLFSLEFQERLLLCVNVFSSLKQIPSQTTRRPFYVCG